MPDNPQKDTWISMHSGKGHKDMNISHSRNTKGIKYKAKHNKFNIEMCEIETQF